MQSVIFVDGHCVRRTTLPRNGNLRRDSDDVFVWEHVGRLLVTVRGRFELDDSDDVFVWEHVGRLLVTVRGRFVLDDSDDVFVWEHVGRLLVNGRNRFVLCVVTQANEAQFLSDIWNNLRLCGGSERVPSLSEDHRQLLCNITASETKDGEKQSETFVDEHCVRHDVRVVVRPEAYRHRTVWIAMYMTSTLRGRRGERQGDAAIMIGACDFGGRPLGFAPRSPRHKGGNTHLSKNTCIQILHLEWNSHR